MHTRASTAALRRLLSHVRYGVLPTSRNEELVAGDADPVGAYVGAMDLLDDLAACAGVAEVGRSGL